MTNFSNNVDKTKEKYLKKPVQESLLLPNESLADWRDVLHFINKKF